MNRAGKERSDREHVRIDTEIERILATEEELLPSSGFLSTVMDRVRHEAALPAPLPFPWKWAIPILLLACAGIVWSTVEFIRIGMQGHGLTALGQTGLSQPWQSWLTISLPHLSANLMRALEQAGWVVMALGMSLVSWLLSRRLAGRGRLL
jgi:hypothetical protein